MEISSIPIAFCVILGNLIICYIIITVLHVFILLNKIKSNQIKPRMKHLSYEDHLIKLNLTTLERRRERGDIIQTYKIMHGLSDVNINELFTMVEDDSITRH